MRAGTGRAGVGGARSLVGLVRDLGAVTPLANPRTKPEQEAAGGRGAGGLPLADLVRRATGARAGAKSGAEESSGAERRLLTSASKLASSRPHQVVHWGPQRALGTGLLGQLQGRLRKLQAQQESFARGGPTSGNTESSLDVLILESEQEGPLKRCLCETLGGQDLPVGAPKPGEQLLVLFSPKHCRGLVLADDQRVRIHSPWNEVRLPDGGRVVLGTHFVSDPAAAQS